MINLAISNKIRTIFVEFNQEILSIASSKRKLMNFGTLSRYLVFIWRELIIPSFKARRLVFSILQLWLNLKCFILEKYRTFYYINSLLSRGHLFNRLFILRMHLFFLFPCELLTKSKLRYYKSLQLFNYKSGTINIRVKLLSLSFPWTAKARKIPSMPNSWNNKTVSLCIWYFLSCITRIQWVSSFFNSHLSV